MIKLNIKLNSSYRKSFNILKNNKSLYFQFFAYILAFVLLFLQLVSFFLFSTYFEFETLAFCSIYSIPVY